VDTDGTVLLRSAKGEVNWWTWAGSRANRTLHASLDIVDPRQRIDDQALRLRPDVDPHDAARYLRKSVVALVDPPVDAPALHGLKFSAAIPEPMAVRTVAERIGDTQAATAVVNEGQAIRYEN
jgi:ATP-dependent Lhr-like helicase